MLTGENETAGTPAYMAPEIALGTKALDGRADIYSVGCVAYYLLTGTPVFSRDRAVATALAHVQEDPVPPSERSEYEIPPALEALILACLAKDPAARPASASELGDRLAATIPPSAWTRQMAHQWWELHDPRLRRSTLHAAVDDGERPRRNTAKQSPPYQTGSHTPVYSIAPVPFSGDEA
jgi:serine/threonine-protein kinase